MVEQEERDVDPFDRLNSILILEAPRQKRPFHVMLLQRSNGRIFLQLERDNEIGPERACNPGSDHGRIVAAGTRRGYGRMIANELGPARGAAA